MPRIGPIILGVIFFAGFGYLTLSYISSDQSSDIRTAPLGNKEIKTKIRQKTAASLPLSLTEIQQQIELTKIDRAFLSRLEREQFGHELFWLTKINILVEEYPEYQNAREKLLTYLRSNNKEALKSIDQVLKRFAPTEYATEKLRLLRLVDLCNGPPELVKEISWHVLETEIISERRDPEKAKNDEEVSLAFANAVNINVQLTAHALYLAVVDNIEGWEGTKTTMQSQVDPWIKSRLAQQYLKKWPSQGEIIRHELVSLLGDNTNRIPANENEEAPSRE